MNKKMKKLMLINLSAAFFLVGCSGYKYKEDNIFEEGFEVAIDHFSGIDVDLSPDTKESGFSPRDLKPFEKLDSSFNPSPRQTRHPFLVKEGDFGRCLGFLC